MNHFDAYNQIPDSEPPSISYENTTRHAPAQLGDMSPIPAPIEQLPENVERLIVAVHKLRILQGAVFINQKEPQV